MHADSLVSEGQREAGNEARSGAIGKLASEKGDAGRGLDGKEGITRNGSLARGRAEEAGDDDEGQKTAKSG